MKPRHAMLSLLALVTALPGAPAAATGWRIDPEATLFAVLTHKAGFASGLAHDHLIVADVRSAALELDLERPEIARLILDARVDELEVDAAAARERWSARLVELGALGEGGLPAIPEKDRGKVRAAMLGASQLDAVRHPRIHAELVALERRGTANARTALGWTARVRLTVRGRSVETDLALRWSLDGEELTAEGLGEARFTDLGIEPYSAFLGAVRNEDLFHLYVALAARRAEAPEATVEARPDP